MWFGDDKFTDIMSLSYNPGTKATMSCDSVPSLSQYGFPADDTAAV